MCESAPYQPHSRTSQEAADAVAPRTPTQRQRVLRALLQAGSGGLTDEETAYRCSMHEGSARARRVELVDTGCVRDSGKTRRTRTGRRATVWVAIALGEQLELVR